jgi:hypothetical protein
MVFQTQVQYSSIIIVNDVPAVPTNQAVQTQEYNTAFAKQFTVGN